jgi:redox-sensitive bicupin YhaK (pirin superfamily)
MTTMLVRKAGDRMHSVHGWLDSWHTFSFADHYDPRYMGFRSLRVINDDTVQPSMGFGTHSHRDMEIISYVLEGALEHKDSIGTGSVIRPGDVQKMSAGSGIAHSEFNHSKSELVHFLQIWIIPDKGGIQPSYEQIHYPVADRAGKLKLVGSNRKQDGVIHIQQDVQLYATVLQSAEQRVEHALAAGRYAWVHVARGTVDVNGKTLSAGDGAALVADTGPAVVTLKGAPEGEALLFDMP